MTTEERVREAAVRLFAERGFHGTGIRDLAQAAGLSSATLYHYMGTKEDLLVSIMRTSLTDLITKAEAIAAEPDETTRIVALVEMHVRAHAEKPRETAVVDGEMRALTGERRAEIVALRDRYEQVWQDAIVDGVKAKKLTVGEPSVARLALLEMCSGVSRWYSPDGPLELRDLTIQYGTMALGMLGADR
ncbi:TetR/AcrR family transcriptional regulator [Lentzea sp. NPDC058450]|uniref:TetR/AcrR family transcriptional regulator n=1 Tax=Lentzea sp. NPDC058450 TaxID=3346505 RepID=UPI00366373F5